MVPTGTIDQALNAKLKAAPVQAATPWRPARIDDPDGYTNLRAGPGTNHPVLAQILDGEVFRTRPAEGRWWRVETSSGVTGYMHVSRIKLLD